MKTNENKNWEAIIEALESAYNFFDWMAEEADTLVDEFSYTDTPAITTAKGEALCKKYNYGTYNGMFRALKGMHDVAFEQMGIIAKELSNIRRGWCDSVRANKVLRMAHKEGGEPLEKKWDKIETSFGGVVDMIGR